MKTTKIILTVLLFVFALSFSMVNGVNGKEVDKLKIGLMFGLTGAGSPIGPVQLEGAKLAIKDQRGRRSENRREEGSRGVCGEG